MNTSIHLPRINMRFVLIVSRIAVLLVASMAPVWPSLAATGSVHARFELGAPQGEPFPSNRFTVPDSSQNTGIRVELPKSDCAAHPSDCADLDVINELDGFNLQPRLSIPFDGPIDVASVTSESVFLVRLGRERHQRERVPGAPGEHAARREPRRTGRRHQSGRVGHVHERAARRVG